MYARQSQYDQYITDKGLVIMEHQNIEWIRTSEAAEILDVKTTQGVLHIVRGEKEPYEWVVRYWNAGTEDMPRYMLAKEDVIALAEKRKG